MDELDRQGGGVALGSAPSWTYAIRQTTGSHLIKIGRAIDPRKRLTDIQAMNGSMLELIDLCHRGDTEADLHWKHAARRAHGEWFDIGSFMLMPTLKGLCLGCAIHRGHRFV